MVTRTLALVLCLRRRPRWKTGCCADRKLVVLFETEKSTEDPGLSAMIVLSNSENLAFSNHLRCFDAFNHVRAVASVRAPCMARHRRLTCR